MPTPRQYNNNADRQKAYRERQQKAREAELQAKGLPAAPAIPTMPGTARWNALLEQALRAIETCSEEMQTYYDDRSEQWQESDKGQEFQERIEQIAEEAENLRNII